MSKNKKHKDAGRFIDRLIELMKSDKCIVTKKMVMFDYEAFKKIIEEE